MSDLYWVHKLKRKQDVAEERFEKEFCEIPMPMWIRLTGCRDVLLLKAAQLPWSPGSKSGEFDYLWVSVWDKEEHRKFIDRGGHRMPSIQPYWDKVNELNLAEMAGSLGAVEPIWLLA